MMNPEAVTQADIDEMARNWYGYGHWNAHFWFIGPEPGMHDDEDGSLTKRCAAWKQLGGGEVVDCKKHHLLMNILDWHRHPRPRLQSTWRRLIKLFLQYHELPESTEDIRLYQRDRFGIEDGDVCVVELSSLAARSLSVERNRVQHRKDRIATLRKRLDKHNPRCLVLYGIDPSSQEAWNALIGQKVNVGQMYRLGNSCVVLVKHPQDHVSDAEWLRNANCLIEASRS